MTIYDEMLETAFGDVSPEDSAENVCDLAHAMYLATLGIATYAEGCSVGRGSREMAGLEFIARLLRDSTVLLKKSLRDSRKEREACLR